MQKAQHISLLSGPSLTFSEKEYIFAILKKHIHPQTKIVIAVSGGPDSMFVACLLFLFFKEQKYNSGHIYIAHCNHNIRPESNEEQEHIYQFFVSKIVGKEEKYDSIENDIGGPVYKKNNLFIKKREQENKKSESDLRQRRYRFLDQVMQRTGSDILILGHNLTDRIESTFLHLLRGASLNGFLSMKPREKHNFITRGMVLRPVISLSKETITGLCKHIPYVIDKSNIDSQVSKRNLLRNEVLPIIYRLSNTVNDTSNSFIQSMQKVYEELDTEETKQQLENKNITMLLPITLSPFRKADRGYLRGKERDNIRIKDIIHILEYLHLYTDITKSVLEELMHFITHAKSGYKYFHGTYIYICHDKIYFIKAPIGFRQKRSDKSKLIRDFGIYSQGGIQIEIKDKNLIGCLCRFPQPGDTYKGKNITKYFINQKIPVFRRNYIPVLDRDGKIEAVYRQGIVR